MPVPVIETLSQQSIKVFQEQKLKETLNYLNQNSPYYSKLFKQDEIDISQIKKLEDLVHIPVTTKQQLQNNNKEFLCVDPTKLIDYVTTSGTSGEPVTFALTDKDLDRLAYNEFLSFLCANGAKENIYQLTATMDRMFMAGLAYFLGARRLGAGIIRVGSGSPELQWDTIQRVRPTTLIGVPSFILKLIEYAEHHNIDHRESSIKSAICIGEPIRNSDFQLNTLGRRLEKKWNLKLYSTYASTEMGTAFTECSEGKGGHHQPELIIVEFLDDNNNPVGADEAGEVAITTIGMEGMPLLRFKTGDVCHRYYDPCACGRNTMRLGPIIGRKNQMIKYKGTTLYPSALYNVLDSINGISDYMIEVSRNEIGTDEILIKAYSSDPSEELAKEIKDHVKAKLRVTPSVELETLESFAKIQLNTTNRKQVRFIDKRIND